MNNFLQGISLLCKNISGLNYFIDIEADWLNVEQWRMEGLLR